MKIALIVLLGIAIIGCSNDTTPYDFRESRWGDSKAEVIASEPILTRITDFTVNTFLWGGHEILEWGNVPEPTTEDIVYETTLASILIFNNPNTPQSQITKWLKASGHTAKLPTRCVYNFDERNQLKSAFLYRDDLWEAPRVSDYESWLIDYAIKMHGRPHQINEEQGEFHSKYYTILTMYWETEKSIVRLVLQKGYGNFVWSYKSK